MRISSACAAVLLGCSLCAAGLSAQTAQPPPLPLQVDSSVQPAPTWKNRVLTGLGAAALGAGVGFFASQINQSDWTEVPGHHEANRGVWAAVGGGIGFAVGFSFPIGGKRPAQDPLPVPAGGRSVISFEEIQGASVDNALDVVRLLRPEWLNTRPPDRLGETQAKGSTVYLDDFRYGDLDSLRSIHASMISSIRFVSAAEATARWGPGNVMGVIQVIALP